MIWATNKFPKRRFWTRHMACLSVTISQVFPEKHVWQRENRLFRRGTWKLDILQFYRKVRLKDNKGNLMWVFVILHFFTFCSTNLTCVALIEGCHLTSKVMKNNRRCNCNIQWCGSTTILRDVDKKVADLALLLRESCTLLDATKNRKLKYKGHANCSCLFKGITSHFSFILVIHWIWSTNWRKWI